MQLFSPFGPAWTRLLRQCIDDIPQCWEWQVDLCTCRDSAVDRLRLFPFGKVGFSPRNDVRFPRGPHYQTTHHYRSKIVWRATPSFKRSPVAPETWGKLTTGIGHDPMTGCMCILNISYGYTGLTHQKGWVYMITVMVNIMTCLMNFNDINNQLCWV